MPDIKVEAQDVQEGDFLPGLGDGYVFTEVEHQPDVRGEFNVRLGNEDAVLIMFHDRNGEENYLLCEPDMHVTVRRDGES